MFTEPFMIFLGYWLKKDLFLPFKGFLINK